MAPLLSVIHEDDDLLVVDKPAGLVCHPTKGGEDSSLIGRIRLHLRHGEGRLVNRLDRETSGVVLVARHAAAARDLGRVFARRDVRKCYLAIVQGHLAGQGITVEAPLGRDTGSRVAVKDCVRADGAPARTDIRALARVQRDGRPYSLVEAVPFTGRKHQIRIHLAHVGHPVVGDKIYGDDEELYLRLVDGTLTSDDERRLLVRNHLLHAQSVSLTWCGRAWRFEAPPGEEFAGFLASAADAGRPGFAQSAGGVGTANS